MRKRTVTNCLAAADHYEAAAEAAIAARGSAAVTAGYQLKAGDAINCAMRIHGTGNILLLEGTLDTPANKKFWGMHGGRALSLIKAARASHAPYASDAAATAMEMDAFMYSSSSKGIIKQALTGVRAPSKPVWAATACASPVRSRSGSVVPRRPARPLSAPSHARALSVAVAVSPDRRRRSLLPRAPLFVPRRPSNAAPSCPPQAGVTFKALADELTDVYSSWDGFVGHCYLGGFYWVAPWPIGNKAKGVDNFEAAFKAEPRSRRNGYYACLMRYNAGDFDGAVRACETALSRGHCDGPTTGDYCGFLTEQANKVLALAKRKR